MPDASRILELYETRRKSRSSDIERMAQVARTYNGDVVVPLPELSKNEMPAVANLVTVGLDQTAQRIASRLPDTLFPPLHPSRQARRKADRRRDVVSGWWRDGHIAVKFRQRARYFVGYASAPVLVRPPLPGARHDQPSWHTRSPLHTFPSAAGDVDDLRPDDAIFTHTRPLAYLEHRWPEAIHRLHKGFDATPDTHFTVLEYVDADEIHLVVVGRNRHEFETGQGSEAETLERLRNRASVPLAVIPGRLTLDRAAGQFDGILGLHHLQAELMAMNLIATKKGIIPETWLVADTVNNPQIIQEPNPITGQIGVVKGGRLEFSRPDPSFAAFQNLDIVERAQRLGGGIPQNFGGESGANIRSGSQIEELISAAVDFPIQEAQEIFAASMEEENRIAIAVAKGWGGNRSRSVTIPSRNGPAALTYQAAELFDSDEHTVSFSHPGADINRLVISAGQRIGIGTLSKRSFMEVDPLVSDPESEMDRITHEALHTAVLASIQAQAQDPAGPFQPVDMARLMDLVVTDRKELPEAIAQVQREAQQRQATPAEPGSPETQPGLSPPGVGVEQPAAAPSGPPDLGALLASLGG